MSRQKRCFTFVHCNLHSKCELAHVDPIHGYFDPQNVGEHCGHFKALTVPVLDAHADIYDMLARSAGAHK